jgi:Xaa-Pro aminopeptidase
MNETLIDHKLQSNRLQMVREKLSDWEVKSILIESAANRFWLSGFTGSAGWLLVSEDKAILGTDSRYWVQASSQSPEFELMRFQGGPDKYLADFVSEAVDGPIGIESEYLTLKQYEQLKGLIEAEWIQLDGSLEALRRIKTNEEIETIRKAAALTDKAMAKVNELAKPGITERELAWQLEKIMREAGASALSFPVIVASGPNAARPHHEPGERRLTEGDSIIVDMGAKFGGYCSDLTRSFFLSEQPSSRFREIYGTVLAAQESALENMKSGMSGKEIDSLARNIIDDAGYGEEFGHGLGHGVGIDIHESPNLSPRAPDDGLMARSVVTVEPAIYIEDWGGVRIEDLVMLTEDGIEILSHCQKISQIHV